LLSPEFYNRVRDLPSDARFRGVALALGRAAQPPPMSLVIGVSITPGPIALQMMS
jgi:hypothetical protein